MMKDKRRQILIHLLGCVSFLALAFIPSFQGKSNRLLNPMALRDFVSYALLIGVFYLNYFLIVPKLYFAKRYLLYFLSVAVLFMAFRTATHLFQPEHQGHFKKPPPMSMERKNPPPPPRGDDRQKPENDFFIEINAKVFPFLVVVFFSLMLRISNRWQQTEKEKINSELSYLKAQINPHFLFNTLNSIYSLAIQKSDETPLAVVKLSGMMRYVLSESANDFVALDKEINYIQNYIDLQKIRFGESLPVSFSVSGSLANKRIAPLILIPFIENAFKHGVNAEEESEIKIEISVKDHILYLSVFNKKVIVFISEENRSGIGVENTKNRLQLLYPRQHHLEIRDEPEDYLVNLEIDLS
jgi:hypothetical protein